MNSATVSRLKAAAAAAMVLGSVGAAGATMIGGTYQDYSDLRGCGDCAQLSVPFGLAPTPSGLTIKTISCTIWSQNVAPFSVELLQTNESAAIVVLPISQLGASTLNVWASLVTNLHYGVPAGSRPRVLIKWSDKNLRQANCSFTGTKN